MHEETQYIDKDTRESVHSNLGMFVLVLMSHGGYGTISAGDDVIRLGDIYRLLSSHNFPAMRGKPKMIILQACSGGQVYYFSFVHATTLLCQIDIKPTSMIISMHVTY